MKTMGTQSRPGLLLTGMRSTIVSASKQLMMEEGMRETTDIAMGVNPCIAVLVGALVKSGAVSSDDILASLARIRSACEKNGEVGQITAGLLQAIEEYAGAVEAPTEEPQSEPRWRPVLIQRDDPDSDA